MLRLVLVFCLWAYSCGSGSSCCYMLVSTTRRASRTPGSSTLWPQAVNRYMSYIWMIPGEFALPGPAAESQARLQWRPVRPGRATSAVTVNRCCGCLYRYGEDCLILERDQLIQWLWEDRAGGKSCRTPGQLSKPTHTLIKRGVLAVKSSTTRAQKCESHDQGKNRNP